MTKPSPMPTMTLTLSENDARFVLEALQALESKWLNINHTTADENQPAEYGMDAIDLHATRQSIQRQAVRAFGPSVTNFSREPYSVSASQPEPLHPR